MAVSITTTKDIKPTKFERVFEDEDSTSIWKYDLNKNPYGPISTEIKYKKGFSHSGMNQKKFLKDLVKEEKSRTQ
jgi:hypothetical protein